MMGYVQVLLFAILDWCCGMLLFEGFFRHRFNIGRWKRYAAGVLSILLLSGVSWIGNSNYLLKVFCTITIFSAVVTLNFETGLIPALLSAIGYYGILLAVDSIGNYFVFHLPKELFQMAEENWEVQNILFLLNRVFVFLFVLCIRRLWKRTDGMEWNLGRKWFLFLYFPLFTIVVLFSIVLEPELMVEPKAAGTLSFISVGMVIMNLIIFLLIRDSILKERQIQIYQRKQEQVQNQLELYENMESQYQRQRSMIHDYKNQMLCIQGLLEKEKESEVREVVRSLSQELCHSMPVVDTKHNIINVILNQKYEYAQRKGISISLLVNDLSDIQIAKKDLVVLLSNVLDNAIEACEKLNTGKKPLITFKMLKEEGQIVMSVKNPVLENVVIQKNHITTTKKDQNDHGIGLENVKEAVEKYDGILSMQCRNGEFIFTAVIPNSGEVN
ncbi:MAG: GHKL domain-containing protein [Clostridiales bacterium]|nr:GHKL domain-containing protein [Clostridiales bacterium]